MTASAPLAEVFVSFQGEGPLVGVCQAFIRVRGCDIDCTWCDSPHARDLDGDCTLQPMLPGEPVSVPNPFTAADALDALKQVLADTSIHSIAVTGGEPLLYPDFVSHFARLARGEGLPVFLETGGHRPDELARLIDDITFVSLDFKLPGALRVPVPAERFAASYRVAGQKCVAVKMVVSADTPPAEVSAACRALALVSDARPVVLQPVTQVENGPRTPGPDHLLALFLAAARHIRDVRIIPQCHRILGVA